MHPALRDSCRPLRAPRPTTLLALAAACLAACQRDARSSPTGAAPIPVECTELARKPLRATVEAVGDLRPSRSVVVAAEIAGRVRGLYVDVGGRVAARQVLARLDSTKSTHSLSLAAAEVQRARTALQQRRRDLARAQHLARRGTLARAQLESAQSAAELAAAQLRAVRARQALTRSQLRDSRVRAPFAGEVAKRHVEIGAYLLPGQPAFTLIDRSSVEVEVGVPPAAAPAIAVGDRCPLRIRALPKLSASGRVKTRGAAADRRTRQVPITLEIANPAGTLVPGMIAEVRCFTGPARATLSIPIDAVVEHFTVPYAFVVERQRARRRRLELGPRHGGQVVVRSGLRAGERLVVIGQESLSDGARVRVVERNPRPTPTSTPAR